MRPFGVYLGPKNPKFNLFGCGQFGSVSPPVLGTTPNAKRVRFLSFLSPLYVWPKHVVGLQFPTFSASPEPP
ncbi:hypothetical protein GBA52_028827 [Prunus armeniaca]|nr:hypothetical protein GBA52_028827 [Prunus armeniaca]